jgi:hypothetical protein
MYELLQNATPLAIGVALAVLAIVIVGLTWFLLRRAPAAPLASASAVDEPAAHGAQTTLGSAGDARAAAAELARITSELKALVERSQAGETAAAGYAGPERRSARRPWSKRSVS